MARHKLTAKERQVIDDAVKHFEEHHLLFKGLAESVLEYLRSDEELAKYIHFIKHRVKSSKRLREKLIKKALARTPGKTAEINAANLFAKINDLAGVRILHLHTNQMNVMNGHIKRILKKNKIKIVEGPLVHCWDRDYEDLFTRFGIAIKKPSKDPRSRESLYTSVHYILEAYTKNKITIELQVRTLADELWGEVSHRVGYEEDEPDAHVQDQLKVLARLTSACTRQVDCVFDTFADLPKQKRTRKKKPKTKGK